MTKLSLNNTLNRLVAYHSLCSSSYYKSITAISTYCNIPLNVVRADFIFLFKSDIFDILCSIYDMDEYISIEECKKICSALKIKYTDMDTALEDISVFFDGPKNRTKLETLFKDGLFDNIPFEIQDISSNEPYSDGLLSIPVDVDEYMAYMNIYEQNNMPKRIDNEKTLVTTTIRNKKYVCEFDHLILDKLEAIEQAIDQNLCIKFKYNSFLPSDGHENISEISILPLKIGFDATNNVYVVISTKENDILCYNIENIVGEILVDRKATHITSEKLLKHINKVWGFEYDKCLNKNGTYKKGTRVKVKFFNEANVINKVRRDLFYRTPIKLGCDKTGNLVYEDIIYGEDSFISWVLSFGSSAQILEPQPLVDKIIYELTKMKNI